MPDEALVEAIRELLAASPFHGEGYRKIWARLRFAGIRTSKRRVLRLMREHGLLAPSRVGRPHGPKAHDGTIRTERVDEMWGTDLTSTLTGEGQASIFVTVDHCSTECLGIHAARRATRFEALEPLRQGVRACFGAFAEGIAGGLKLRHDHGSQFVADDYQRELAFLGIASSPAFVREPEGNGCVERFIRTLQGEPALGPPLRHHRGAAPGAARVQGHLQPDLDRRAPRLPDPRGRQSGAARAAPSSRMNPQRGVSQLWTATKDTRRRWPSTCGRMLLQGETHSGSNDSPGNTHSNLCGLKVTENGPSR